MHRHKLETDVNAEPWELLEHTPFRKSLGLPEGSEQTVGELMTPTLGPGTIAEPLRLDVAGRSEANLMVRSRGFDDEATSDLIVSPTLEAILRAGNLPRQATIACEAFVFPAGSFGVLPRNRKPKGPHPFRWLWWQEYFADRLDPQRSRFRIRFRDGTIDHASYESLEDLAQVRRRAANTLDFDLRLETIAWSDPAVDALDVVPMDIGDVYLSDAMADRLSAAALPGVRVVPLDR